MVVCPIKAILYQGHELEIIHPGETIGPLTQRVWDALTDIQVNPPTHPPTHPSFYLPSSSSIVYPSSYLPTHPPTHLHEQYGKVEHPWSVAID